MATTIEKTIGSGGDYATIALWKAAIPANLVTADEVWKGVLLNQAFNEQFVIDSGYTTDATRYIWLTADSSTWHKGVPGIGPRIVYTSTLSSGDDIVRVQINYTIVEKIEITYQGAQNHGVGDSSSGCKATANATGIKFRHILSHDINISDRNRGVSMLTITDGELSSCIIYNVGKGTTTPDCSGIRLDACPGTRVSGCTVDASDHWGIEVNAFAGQTTTCVNNMAFGSSVKDFHLVALGGGVINSDNNMSGDATADDVTGTGNQINMVAHRQFVDRDNRNYHLRHGADAIKAGSNLGAGFWSVDIDGTERRATGAWDIGADERSNDANNRIEIVRRF